MANFAKIRTGTSLLGALKMDIDNLGRLFNNCTSVSDFETKSKIIHDFFSISLHKLLEEEFYTSEKYKWSFKENIYTVYSGGDDCFFIGAWDAMVQFAHSIKERFDSEINNSKDLKLTLSAGVVLFSPSTPVVKIGTMAEDSLSNAKRRIVNGKIEKNGINLMQEVFSWTDYKGIVQQKKMLTSLIQNDFIQRSLLEKIKKSSKGFEGLQNKIKRNKSLPIASVYRLKYYLSDVNVEQRNDIINEIFEPYSNALLEAMKIKSTNNITNDFTNPMRFPAAARLAEFSTRILKIKTNEKN
jgi:CRISPR-associated protein Csm1